VGRRLFVAHEIMTDRVVPQPVVQGQDARARVAEDDIDAFLLEDLKHNVRTDGFHNGCSFPLAPLIGARRFLFPCFRPASKKKAAERFPAAFP